MDAASVNQDQARAEDEPKPQEPTPTHRGGGAWPLWLFIAPVIYVLSIGPVAKLGHAVNLNQKAPAIERVLETIYIPVMWCAGQSRPSRNALDWYLFSFWKI